MSEFDPVSDFLAREQQALGDLGDDFKLSEDIPNTEVRSCEPVSDASYVFLNGQSTMNGSHFGHNLTEPDYRANNSVHDFDTMVSSDSNVRGTESWREEFDKRIKAKDAEEEKRCAELMETGKKELNDWYKNYHQKLETRSRELREKKHDSNGHFMNGDGSKPSVKDTAVWESICNLCDFQSKQKTAIDTSRMRSILLSLKPNN
ncbi:unnamed protein product [Schistosoma spindalis]|nr:unnamed protein product [Schistosoma spindale]